MFFIQSAQVDDARLQLFTLSYGFVDDMEKFKKKVTNFDACTLPPCFRELQQQIYRTVYIASVWRNATSSTPSTLDPLDHGWKISSDGYYTFHWFDGEEMPNLVKDIIVDPDNDQGTF